MYDFNDIDIASHEAYEGQSEYQKRNHEMNLAWQFISSTNVSVFLTGKAGTGKTTFLRRLRELMPKRMVVLAPTGVAAINAGGQTINSFFQLPFGPYIPGVTKQDPKQSFKMSQKKKDLIRTLDLLVIDEVSMVRADMLDQVDDMLRQYRDRTKPFGGVQLLLIGDLMQLSPVAKPDEWSLLAEHYDTPYFFSSHALKQSFYVTVELKHIYRQQDDRFINLLANIRNGMITDDDVRQLNARYIPSFKPTGDDWIRLTTHNLPAQQYNEYQLSMLSTPTHVLRCEIEGEFPEYSYPTDPVLSLKIGAQVMFVKNDLSPAHAYYNGKIGIVRNIAKEYIEVACDNGSELIEVTPVSWDNTKYSIDSSTKAITEQVVGTFKQYPLRLAWAITVHKSQGLTFDHAVLDINASFAHGQVYVALSRCRSLEGLVLSSPLAAHSIITDSTVNSYIDQALSMIDDNVKQLPRFRYEYTLSLLDDLYSFQKIEQDYRWLTRVVDEYLSRQQRHLLLRLKELEQPFRATVSDIAFRFGTQYTKMMQQTGGKIKGTPLEQRIKESSQYFATKLHELFDPLLDIAVINIDNKQVGEIYNNALSALEDSLRAKLTMFNSLKEQTFSTQAYLNIKAKSLLTSSSTKPKRQKPSKKQNAEKDKPKKKHKKGYTLLETERLFKSGMTIAEIAKTRGLAESTIYGHLAALVENGSVNINDVVSSTHQEIIRETVKTFKSSYTIADVRELLPEDITYGEIRIVVQSLTK